MDRLNHERDPLDPPDAPVDTYRDGEWDEPRYVPPSSRRCQCLTPRPGGLNPGECLNCGKELPS